LDPSRRALDRKTRAGEVAEIRRMLIKRGARESDKLYPSVAGTAP
jgi:hypothetical protein